MDNTDPRWYVFRNAVYGRKFVAAGDMLREFPALLFLANGLGETALHFLAVENDIEGVTWLRGKGSDIDTSNLFGTPAIFEVAELGYKELFLWFSEHGANLLAQDKNGQGIIEYLLESDQEEMAGWVRQHLPSS